MYHSGVVLIIVLNYSYCLFTGRAFISLWVKRFNLQNRKSTHIRHVLTLVCVGLCVGQSVPQSVCWCVSGCVGYLAGSLLNLDVLTLEGLVVDDWLGPLGRWLLVIDPTLSKSVITVVFLQRGLSRLWFGFVLGLVFDCGFKGWHTFFWFYLYDQSVKGWYYRYLNNAMRDYYLNFR